MIGFPLLLIPLALFNIIAFLMPTVSFTDVLFRVPMMTGEAWPVTLSDILLAFAVILLLLEVVKGARPGAKFLMDHLLSLIVFGGAAAEFILLPKFGNSTFFLLTLLAMADFFGGVAQRSRRRGYVAEAAPAPRKSKRRDEVIAEDAPTERRLEPMPQPVTVPQNSAAQSARSVAESVLMEHPAPKPAPTVHSPEVSSPHLQPSNGAAPTDEPPR